jgi:prevent-host-death family protein
VSGRSFKTVANELSSSYNPTDELVPMAKAQKNESIVVSALRARTNFGRLLQRVENERRSLVIEKRGAPRAILLSIRDYVRLATPEPEVLAIIGEESKAKGTDALNSQQIDNIIRAARHNKTKRR